MSVTIKQIANAAGVSRGTVDRALNGRSGIKPEVAQRIREVAAELGYTPNYAAKMLSDRQYSTRKIGIILVAENNPFFDEVLDGVKAALSEYEKFGLESIIRIQQNYACVEEQSAIMDFMKSDGVGGIVMTPIYSSEITEKINSLSEDGVKIITVNSDIPDTKRAAYVGCRFRKSGAVLAGLLGLMSGGKKMSVGVLAGSKRNYAVLRRTCGLTETLAEKYPNVTVAALYENENNEKDSYRLTEKMLKEQPRLDVLCVLGAGMAGAIKAVKDSACGAKLRVTTYDMIPEVREAIRDGIVTATITQEPFRQGYDSVQLLARYVAYGEAIPPENIYTQLAIVTKECLDEE